MPAASGVTFQDLNLRRDERGFLLGGTGSGKTTLEEFLIVDFCRQYSQAQILILDSKPRFRAEWTRQGIRAKRQFKNWAPGQTLPDSCLITEPGELRAAFDQHQIVIAQCSRREDRRRLLAVADRFMETASYRRHPRLLAVDETADFFHGNGMPIGSDVLERVARAGRERGVSGLYCSQRARALSSSLMENMSALYLFATDYVADVKRCQEMGAPPGIQPPTRNYEFLYWTKRDRGTVYGPFYLDL